MPVSLLSSSVELKKLLGLLVRVLDFFSKVRVSFSALHLVHAVTCDLSILHNVASEKQAHPVACCVSRTDMNVSLVHPLVEFAFCSIYWIRCRLFFVERIVVVFLL